MKLLCFGDLHLGHGAQIPGRLDDQRDVLGRIAGLAVEHGVDGILFAGDAFEGPASAITPEQLDVFAAFVSACRTVEIPILAISGNSRHDAAVRDKNGLAIFDYIDGITVCSQPGVHGFAGCGIAVLPWVHPGRLIARAGRDVPRDEVNAIAADLLVDVARELRGQANIYIDGNPTILLGHWSVSGASLPAGLPVDELREPVLPIDELEQLGYDALVFGHIHRSQLLGTPLAAPGLIQHGLPVALYTGSPMPLNFGEEHVDHGVWILDLGASTTEFVLIDSPRFVTVGLSIDDTHGSSLDSDADVTDAIVRVQFTASREQMRHIDVAGLRASLLEAGARVVKVEPQIIREQRARVDGVDEQLDELAALEMWIEATAYSGDGDALRDRARDLLEAVA